MHPNQVQTILRNVLTFIMSVICFTGSAELIVGMVRDSITTEGIPYASIIFEGNTGRVVANGRGMFKAVIPDNSSKLTAYSQGYAKKTVNIKRNRYNLYDIYLAPEKTELKELVVQKSKYRKKNNPAVDFAKRLKKSALNTNPRTEPYYSYDRYEIISLGLHGFQYDSTQWLERTIPTLKEHIDTSALTGAPVLTVSVKESVAKVYSRAVPEKEIEVVDGYRSEGIEDKVIDTQNMREALSDLFGEVDLYQSEIPLLQNHFISPLSAVAPDFYRFYLTDTVEIDGDKCIALAFYPKEKSSVGFSGHLYVKDSPGDSLLIKMADLYTAPGIGVNFIDGLHLTQTYANEDGKRLKQTDELEIVLAPISGKGQVAVKRTMRFTGHSFEEQADSIFAHLGKRVMTRDYDARDPRFWEQRRTASMTKGEESTAQLMGSLRANRAYYWTEQVLKVLFQGYIPTGKKSKFDIGPVNTFASYNSLEGLRLRAGGMTTANLSPHWFGRGYVAYGFRDHKWKYSVEAEYSFNAKKYHSREFPMNALRLTHRYDVDRLGAHYWSTSPDNFVLSWQRMPYRRYSYARTTRLDYILELNNNLSFNIAVENQRQEASRYLTFRTFGGTELGHYTENFLNLQLRFAPGEKFYQGKSYRVAVNEDAPVVTLTHSMATRSTGSKFAVNKTEIEFKKRFWLSFFGSVETAVGGGHVWGATPFTELFIPNANLSYTIRPRSFALLNPLEFVNSSYVSWDLTYQLRGLILGRIPLVKKAGLREVVGFRGIYGHLSRRCTPSPNRPDLLVFPENVHGGTPHGPYMELAVGLENILRLFRVDYVWRLNYRQPGYPVDRSGVRVAMYFRF